MRLELVIVVSAISEGIACYNLYNKRRTLEWFLFVYQIRKIEYISNT